MFWCHLNPKVLFLVCAGIKISGNNHRKCPIWKKTDCFDQPTNQAQTKASQSGVQFISFSWGKFITILRTDCAVSGAFKCDVIVSSLNPKTLSD